MTKTEILAIHRPEDLFPGDRTAAQSIYRQMARHWHPDMPTGSADVFAHITQLYQQAIEKMLHGRWEGPCTIQLEGLKKHFFTYQAHTTFKFPYGQAIVTDDAVVYVFDKSRAAVFLETTKQIELKRQFSSDDMRAEFDRYLPHIEYSVPLADGRFLLQVSKTPDLIRLRDVVTHIGLLDPAHVAWIISSLLNLACYLTYAKRVHHDISPDTYFISPEHHSGVLLGGWWAAAERGAPIVTVPRRTYDVMPYHAKIIKRASTRTDLELIKLTARECMKLPAKEPLHTWLHSVSTLDAYRQYQDWAAVLQQTFGKRKFVPFPVTAQSVYSSTGKVV